MNKNLVSLKYEGLEVYFTEDGWLNATAIAEKYGKRPVDWLALETTKEYISVLSDILKCENSSHLSIGKENQLIKTKRGNLGGTWIHTDLVVQFARWLDVRFSIWCDMQIRGLIQKIHPHYNWKRIRHESSSSFKVMNAVVQLVRQNKGKETKFFHYANEAKLVNWAITGEFKPLDRDNLNEVELDLLAKLEERNAVLVGCGLERDDRKLALSKFVSDYNSPKQIKCEI